MTLISKMFYLYWFLHSLNYGGLNQMIFLLRHFFSSVLFSLLLSPEVYLSCSVKPLFCKVSWYIGIDCDKNIFIRWYIWYTFFYWFWQLFQYGCGVIGIFVAVICIIIWSAIWLVNTSVKINLYVNEIYCLQIGLNYCSKTTIFEYFHNSFPLMFCLLTCPSSLSNPTDSLSEIFEDLFKK